jgi:hypothetical protein
LHDPVWGVGDAILKIYSPPSFTVVDWSTFPHAKLAIVAVSKLGTDVSQTGVDVMSPLGKNSYLNDAELPLENVID